MKALLTFLTTMLLARLELHGQELISWTNSAGGSFQDAPNWSPARVPNSTDAPVFGLTNSFVINFASNAANSSIWFDSGSITSALGGNTWSAATELVIGRQAGKSANAIFSSGNLIVTNAIGTAKIVVGGSGNGELGIRGASVTVDFLQADAGTNSFFNFDNGEITTLHGSRILYPGKVILGTNSTLAMTWNIKGGTNEIFENPNSQYFRYGGLSLGASAISKTIGSGVLNLSGLATKLFVRDLDIHGNSAIWITDGAQLNSESVEWGLQTKGSNNTVVVSGPASKWVNGDFMDIGEHRSGQTLIITNGGFVQSGFSEFPFGQFYAFHNPASVYGPDTIIISGSGSELRLLGQAELGMVWAINKTPIANLLLITNSGRFSAEMLYFGSPDDPALAGASLGGTLIDVASGTLQVEWLQFNVGSIHVDQGIAKVQELLMPGGPTNAFLHAKRLLVGYHGVLAPGDFQVGGSIGEIQEFSGDVQLTEWMVGTMDNDEGTMIMTGGAITVSDDLLVGGLGSGSLEVSKGTIVAHGTRVDAPSGKSSSLIIEGSDSSLQTTELTVGPRGKISVRDGGILTVSGISQINGVLELTNSALTFYGSVALGSSAMLKGQNGSFVFAGGVHLPASDIILPKGVTVQAATITSDGGQLIDSTSPLRITSRFTLDKSIEITFPSLGNVLFHYWGTEDLNTWTELTPDKLRFDENGIVTWTTPVDRTTRYFRVSAE